MWSDKESSEDYLNFGEVSQLAVDVLTTKNMLPVSIGIFGNWGASQIWPRLLWVGLNGSKILRMACV